MKKVVITGATKGIGKAIAVQAAQKGFSVAICARNGQDLAQFKTELAQINPNISVLGMEADMSKQEDCQKFADYVKTNWGAVDILVNNAGVFLPCRLTEAGKEADFIKMMDTNLYSAYFMTQYLLNAMPDHAKAHVFNICSIASIMPYSAYSVSKFAMLGFSKVLRAELMQRGIRVTAMLPGATLTNSWAGVDLPQERFMSAEDVAAALWSCYDLSECTVVEEILLRPMLGDI